MYCVYCGTKLPDGARFCFMCGKGVEPDRGAKDNAASTNECNDEEAADTDKTVSDENPGTFAAADDAGETSSEGKAAGTLEVTNEGSRNENAPNEKDNNESEMPSEGANEGQTEKQPDKEACDTPESTDKSTSNEKDANEPEASGENGADGAKVAEGSPTPNPTDSPAPGISSDKTTVIPLATPSDKTTILPGFGAEKAALEQEKSDEIAALAALYPDANPEQFCDPTPFEAKSPDITEFIAPMPINGAKPASAESIHYAESPKKKSAGKRALLIAIVVIIAALAAAAAFGMSLDISPN